MKRYDWCRTPWTPVISNGLPNPKDYDEIWATVKIDSETPRRSIRLQHNHHYDGWYSPDFNKGIDSDSIIAWMPYTEPTPYLPGMRNEIIGE